MITKEKSPQVRGIEGMVYKRGWREESEGGNCNYILIKNIINKKDGLACKGTCHTA